MPGYRQFKITEIYKKSIVKLRNFHLIKDLVAKFSKDPTKKNTIN
jgi:hypothetical protein